MPCAAAAAAPSSPALNFLSLTLGNRLSPMGTGGGAGVARSAPAAHGSMGGQWSHQPGRGWEDRGAQRAHPDPSPVFQLRGRVAFLGTPNQQSDWEQGQAAGGSRRETASGTKNFIVSPRRELGALRCFTPSMQFGGQGLP